MHQTVVAIPLSRPIVRFRAAISWPGFQIGRFGKNVVFRFEIHFSERLMERPIVSVSGLRGIIGTSLTPDLAADYATAFSNSIGEGPIVVTRDGRATGQMLADAIAARLNAIGRDVLFGDVAATPTTGILVREHGAAGGIQISASHNPAPYNGMKLFGPDGRVLTAVAGEKVREQWDDLNVRWADYQSLGRKTVLSDTTSAHLNKVLDTVNACAIGERGFRVVLDSNHGAGSVLGRLLLESLNCDVLLLGGTPDGQFEHAPEPTAENLQGVCDAARRHRADVVFCQDPDADRLALIDEQGRYVGEEYTLALTAWHRLSQTPGPLVINLATSQMNEDIARQLDCPIFRAPVGEANVVDMMIANRAVYGGEGNGGPIDPRVGYVRDSFVGMAQVLDAMARTQKTLSALVDQFPRYAIVKTKVQLDPQRIPDLYQTLERQHTDALADLRDGLRLEWRDRWLLVRPSNTEPIVRIIAEAPDEATAQALCQEVADRIAATP